MANKVKSISLAAIVVILAAGTLLLWLKIAHGPETSAGLDVIRLSNTLSDGALIADEKGFFSEHNISIKWTGKLAHGPAAIVALVGGQNDAAGSISTAMIIARTHGADVKIIASSTISSDSVPLFRYLVKDGSPISGKPLDFIGKKVVASPTTITWYPLVVYLKRGGVDPSQVNFLTMPSPIATEQALRSGQVDVIGASEYTPPGTKLLAEGGVHFISGVSDYDILHIRQIGGWAMREDFIDKHPDLVRRFVAALAQGYRWSNAHPNEAQAILNKRNEVPPEYWKYQNAWREVPEDAKVDSQSVRQWVSILEEFGQIAPGSVKAEDVYTNDYVPAAAGLKP
jgi:ABC-type nitrate/sulfonate/bicarbonate transport system substrate-binding protein